MTALAWIALTALAFTAAQVWIAHRKLRLDLFEKRFETYEAINTVINERVAEIDKSRLLKGEEINIEKLRKFWELKRKMVVLFPLDMHKTLNEIENMLIEYSSANLYLGSASAFYEERTSEDFKKRYDAFIKAGNDLRDKQEQLAHQAHRYVKQYGWVEECDVYIRRWAGPHWSKVIERWRRYRAGPT